MIESCSKRRMMLAIFLLGATTVIIIILESTHLESSQVDIHESDPILKEKMKPEEKCWQREKFEILESCHHCSSEEISSHNPVVCAARGFKERVKCASGNETYRACDKVVWVEERRFWIFETVMFFLGCFSAGMVYLRQKQLDHIVYKRIQKQIANGA